MIIVLNAKGFEDSEVIKGFAETKIRFALARFGPKIRHIDVMLSDINGPKGGEDKRCRVKLSFDALSSIVIQETCDDIYEAITLNAARLKRTVSRHIDKDISSRRLKSDRYVATTD